MNISENFSWKQRMLKRENSPLLPSNIRALIIGKSSCGKTTLLLNLLLQPNWLDYNHLYNHITSAGISDYAESI